MKQRHDFATEEEYQEFFDNQFDLPELPPFQMVKEMKQEQLLRQDELNRKSKGLKDEQSKLGALKAQVNNLILSGAKESELDKVYDQISKQEVIVQRRDNEYTIIAQAKETTKFTQAELIQSFKQYKDEYERVAILPAYEKLASMKKAYLKEVNALERQLLAFNDQAKNVDGHLRRLHNLQGGVILCATSISLQYENIEIKIPRNPKVW